MSEVGTYYLNALTLAAATAIYTDEGHTICAPDGYYSDGSVSRRLLDCVLLPEEVCRPCEETPPVVALWPFLGSIGYTLDVDACATSDIDKPYYCKIVNGTVDYIGIYDEIYVDINGSITLASVSGAGYYNVKGLTTDYDWFRIDANSIVIELGTCI